jgi:hypothetical protein
MAAFLSSDLPLQGRYPTLAFAGAPGADPTLGPGEMPTTPAGSVRSAFARPADGRFGGEVRADRTAVVMLKASFDPRWSVLVDGTEARPEMIAPGFVGVRVGAGIHRVLFEYQPYPAYWALFAFGAAVMIALLSLERHLGRPRSRDDERTRNVLGLPTVEPSAD